MLYNFILDVNHACPEVSNNIIEIAILLSATRFVRNFLYFHTVKKFCEISNGAHNGKTGVVGQPRITSE